MYQIKKFEKLSCSFSTKDCGNMDFRFGNKKEVIKNRELFFKRIGVPLEKTVFLSVLHKDGIEVVNKKDLGKGTYWIKDAIPSDGLLTNKRKTFLCLLVADCLPVIVFDSKKMVTSIIHAGWKGLDKKIVENAVSLFKERYRSNLKDLSVIIGPGIRKESYVFKKIKQVNSKEWKNFIAKRKDGFFSIDLVTFLKYKLEKIGVQERNIFDCKLDTAKSKLFFSHFRDKNEPKKQGRFVCVAGML